MRFPSGLPFLKIILVFILLAALLRVAAAVEVTQWAGAAHAYPGLFNAEGKKLGNGEFTQQIEGDLLKVRITYDLRDGREIKEKGSFVQRPEFRQKSWSWEERKDDTLLREFKVDFDAGTASARKEEKGELKEWNEKVEIAPGRTFAGFGFPIALGNLRDRLVKGETIELEAVGFTPKPRVVTVQIAWQGVDRVPMSGRELRGDRFLIRPQIPAIAKVFVKISDTYIWLTPPPAGFLRWEGPLAEPSDEIVRVDLISASESERAKSAGKD